MEKERDKNDLLRWRFHYNNFRHEVMDSNKSMWVLAAPFDILTQKLVSIAKRSAMVGDPILIDLCSSLALYEFSDPTSVNYNEKIVEEVRYKAVEFARKERAESATETYTITFYETPDCDATGILLTTSTKHYSDMEFDEEKIEAWNDEHQDDPVWANQSYSKDAPVKEVESLIELFKLHEVEWPSKVGM